MIMPQIESNLVYEYELFFKMGIFNSHISLNQDALNVELSSDTLFYKLIWEHSCAK